MATRIDNDVTLRHSTAQEAARLLNDYAGYLNGQAPKLRGAVRESCRRNADRARAIATEITAGLWAWEDGV